MKNKLLRALLLLVSIYLISTCIYVPVCASEVDKIYDKYQQIADEATARYTPSSVGNMDDGSNSYPILDVYNQIIDIVYDSETDTYNELYGGAYVENDKLVILYVNNIEPLLADIKETVNGCDHFVSFACVNNSYNSLYSAKKALDTIMRNQNEYAKRWNSVESSYFDSIVQYYIHDRNNKLHITVKPNAKTSDMTIEGETSDLLLLGQSNQHLIEYEYKDLDYELYNSTESVYPGQAIYNLLVNPVTNQVLDDPCFSIGLRGQYVDSNGRVYFGFLTVEHGFVYNDWAYIKQGTIYRLIGTAVWKKLDDSIGVDAAFVALEDEFEMTNMVYFAGSYTGSSLPACDCASGPTTTGDRIYFANYYTHMPSGYAIYSNGSTTGKTSGTIVSFDTTIRVNNEIFYHYCTVTNPFAPGDSGGVMYSNASSNGTYSSYITVGMVEGGNSKKNIAFISTYHRLMLALDNDEINMGNISFLTLY